MNNEAGESKGKNIFSFAARLVLSFAVFVLIITSIGHHMDLPYEKVFKL